jgi:hypothetical protein
MSIGRKRAGGCRAHSTFFLGPEEPVWLRCKYRGAAKKLRLARHHSTAVSLGTGSRPYLSTEQAGYP